MLLKLGSAGGWYFHVADPVGFPRYTNAAEFRRYLNENGQTEINRKHVPLKNPEASQWKLEELLSKRWTWFVLPNNCAHFVEEVLQAGGTSAGLYSNCPSREIFR